MQSQVGLEDPGTTGPDDPAFHQWRGTARAAANLVGAPLLPSRLHKRKRNGPPENRRAVKWSATTRYGDLRTLDACSPFGPFVTSNSTLSPSARLLKPCA